MAVRLNLPSDYTTRKIWDIAKDCRKAAANAEEEIFRLTDGRIGDIMEIFWSGPDSELYLSETPSMENVRLQPHVSPFADLPELFANTTASIIPNPGLVYFNSQNTILFFSPMMTANQVGLFIAAMESTELSKVQRVAINRDIFKDIDQASLKLWIRFSELREVLLTSEKKGRGDTYEPGPTVDPRQEVFFYLAPGTAMSSSRLCDVLDLRTMVEKDFDLVRRQTGAWPAGHVTVDVAWVERNGKLMKTEFPSENYLDIETGKYLANIFNNVADGESPSLEIGDSENSFDEDDQFAKEVETRLKEVHFTDSREPIDKELEVGDKLLKEFAEADRKAANLKKEAEVDRQLKQSNDTEDNEDAVEE
ncbi:hypothetical protein NA56DRAFT_657994 [Hyaloscypha hepaticicola]|uniref:Uncharacterized protein n=1 Tax=Hyaloscypha hepaticicola TaxID=2082293 RepID=A0A2J6Q8J6_9HELO|nr:hypothetical protein NA56DRAFT_657994 [Hyaloscypha hepaticicola]